MQKNWIAFGIEAIASRCTGTARTVCVDAAQAAERMTISNLDFTADTSSVPPNLSGVCCYLNAVKVQNG